jgi:hypothetical protein
MIGSRTDKAHSQNGMSGSDYLWQKFLRRDSHSAKLYSRPKAKAQARQILSDELTSATVNHVKADYPGLKRMRYSTVQPIQLPSFYELERERLANLERIETNWREVKALTLQHSGWREVALSDCEFGCKRFERTVNNLIQSQVQHSTVYGCRKSDEAVSVRALYKPEPVVEFHAPRHQPVGFSDQARREGSLPIAGRNKGRHHANLDFESPSLMQMAAQRAKNLGLTK